MADRDAILSLVCGYSPRDLQGRLLAMLVCHIDESGKGGRLFVVSSLVSTPEKWIRFSEEWQAVLDTPPIVQVSKSSQISPGSPLSEKLPALIRCLNKYVVYGIASAISVESYNEYFRHMVGATFDNPFHHTYTHVAISAAQWAAKHHPGSVVDYVFDTLDDTEFLEISHALRLFKGRSPDRAIADCINPKITQRDDKLIKPLQAADLMAGMIRRSVEDQNHDAKAFLGKIEFPGNGHIWDSRMLASLFLDMTNRSPYFGFFYETSAARSKRLKAERKELKCKRRAFNP